MNKLFKTGILSVLSCTVLVQSFTCYSAQLTKASNTADKSNISSYYENGDLTDYEADDIGSDIDKDYTDGLEILESADLSEEYAKNNNPLYKKYKYNTPKI